MIQKTRGIVLNYIKYRETSIIAKIYTEKDGIVAFLVNSIRSKQSKKGVGHFNPLSILDLVVYSKESRGVQRISEFKNIYPLHFLYQNSVKSAIAILIVEVLSKFLRSEMSTNDALYQFLEKSIITLNHLNEGTYLFLSQFLLKIGHHLGFAVENGETLFTSMNYQVPVLKDHYMTIQKLLEEPYGLKLNISSSERKEVLNVILEFYQHHIHLGSLKSLSVLRTVFDS